MAATKNIDEIASVYAQSLLEVCDRASGPGAGGNAVAEACSSELRDLAEIIRGDRKFAEFLKTPIVGNDKRKAALEKIVKGRVSDLVFRFTMVLANHGRAGRIADVADAFDALMQERLGRIEVDMFTVDGKASDDVIATVKARVKEAFKKDAVLHQYSDPSMIGGVKLRIGDQLIDGSVATQLRSMRESVSTRGSTRIRSRVNDFLA